MTAEEVEKRKQEELNKNKPKEEIVLENNTDVEKKEEKSDLLKPVNNGSVTSTYSWTQPLIQEIGITIPIESWVKSKDIDFKFSSKTLYVAVKVKQGGEVKVVELVNGEFCKTIKVK